MSCEINEKHGLVRIRTSWPEEPTCEVSHDRGRKQIVQILNGDSRAIQTEVTLSVAAPDLTINGRDAVVFVDIEVPEKPRGFRLIGQLWGESDPLEPTYQMREESTPGPRNVKLKARWRSLPDTPRGFDWIPRSHTFHVTAT